MHAAAPMWRNGRRNGLKIRSREKRGMGSTPIIGTSENTTLLRECGRKRDSAIANRHAWKRTKTPSIGQVFVNQRRPYMSFWWQWFVPVREEQLRTIQQATMNLSHEPITWRWAWTLSTMTTSRYCFGLNATNNRRPAFRMLPVLPNERLLSNEFIPLNLEWESLDR